MAKSQECCTCRPYNDGLLTAAQILSILALLLSWSNIISLILGVISFLCLQIVWCCRMRRCGLITTGILAFISGAYSVVVGILVLVAGSDQLCSTAESSVTQDGYQVSYNFTENCNMGVNLFAGLAIGGGALWILIALFVFVFTCGSRYEAFLAERDAADKDVVIMVQQNQSAANPEQPRTVNGVVTSNDV